MVEAVVERPTRWTLTVRGAPQPKGSLRSLRTPSGATVTTASNTPTLGPWMDAIAAAAQTERGDHPPVTGPVSVTMTFSMARPKTRGNARLHHVVRPDLDKLIRAVLDALTGVLFTDDSQVTSITAIKRYVQIAGYDVPGVIVRVESVS